MEKGDKMKKWTPLLLGLIIASPASAHYSKPFSGFYGGLDLGLIQSNVHNDQSVTSTFSNVFNFAANTDARITDTAFTGGIILGYSSCMRAGWVAGLEGRANFQNLDTYIHATMSESISTIQAKARPSVNIKQDFAFVGKLGFVHCYRFLMYGLIGADWAKINPSIDACFEDTLNTPMFGAIECTHSKYKSGLMLGLGVEYYLTKCTTVGLEYNYVNYGRIFNDSISGQLIVDDLPLDGSAFSANSCVKMQTNKFMLKFNYYFA